MSQALEAVSVDESVRVREFSSIEKLHWLLDQNHHNHFSMAAEVTGRINSEMWRRGLDALQRRHPLLTACIRLESGNRPAFYFVEEAGIPLSVKMLSSPSQWEAEFEREITTPFDAQTAPLIRAVLLEGDDRVQIILTAHHTIADGVSMQFLIRDLLLEVSGTSLAPLPTPPSQDQLLAPLLKTLPQDRSVPQAELGHVKKTVPYRPKDGARPAVSGIRLSQQQTTLLVSRAQREQTTVHAALWAAFVLTGREKCTQWKQHGVRTLSPISLRKLLGVGDDCVVALSAANVPLDPPPGVSVWELARQAKQALLPFQSLEGIASMSSAIDGLLSKSREQFFESVGEFGYEFVLTNVQRAPFDGPFGSLSVEALWGPSALNGLEGEQAIAAGTVNNSLCLVHTSYTPFNFFLTSAVDLLMDACNGE